MSMDWIDTLSVYLLYSKAMAIEHVAVQKRLYLFLYAWCGG